MPGHLYTKLFINAKRQPRRFKELSMDIRDAAEIQKAYTKLESGEIPFTKKNLYNLLVPFRDKFHLTDGQVLAIARNELTLSEIADL